MQQRPDRQRQIADWPTTVVALLVVGGLLLSLATGALVIDAPAGALPGVALGSETILVVERAAALFAAWVVTLVVVIRALAGELPVEISGRGFKYADAEASHDAVTGSGSALKELDAEVSLLRGLVFELHAQQIGYVRQGERDKR